jgi:hypothetical protein
VKYIDKCCKIKHTVYDRKREKEIAMAEKQTGLTAVYVAEGLLHAMVVRGVLESAGIPVMLSYEAVGPTYGITIGGIGQVRVMVPHEWFQEATDLLNAKPPKGEHFSAPPDAQNEERSTE